MRAVVARANGGPEVLEIVERPEPVATPGQALVDIRASALNRADLLQAAGVYPPPPGESDIFGLEAAGIERETGRHVCCLLGSGGLAEVVAIDRRLLMPVPRGMSFAHAAAIPEVWLTAYLNLFLEARLEAGEWALIHAAASGVGTAALQLCRRAGAKAIATSRTEAKLTRCQALGAERALVSSGNDFAARVLELTKQRGVDVILDVLGGGALAENLAALAIGGRLVSIALMHGTHAELDMARLLRKRQRIIGSTLRARSVDEKARITARFSAEALPGFDAGELAPVIDRSFAMTEVRQAAERLASNATIGKVTLEW